MSDKAVLNPKKIVELKIISNLVNEKNQIQQNGVDLTVNSIFEVDTSTPCVLSEEERIRPKTNKLELVNKNGKFFFLLKKGQLYDILFNEDIKIPSDMSGFILQRSSLNRMGSFITTGWWDSGFKNKVGGIIRPSIDIYIGENTRLAQIIMLSSDSASEYNGIYNK